MSAYEQKIKGKRSVSMRSFIEAAEELIPAAYSSCPWRHGELDRGMAILASEDALNCYLAAYGEIHVTKMLSALEHLPYQDIQDGFEIVDWGCGQGLASVCFLDWIEQNRMRMRPGRITLVDASRAALSRALLHVSMKLGSGVDACAVQTDLSADSIKMPHKALSGRVTVHLLSNIIDVPVVNVDAITRAIVAYGHNNYVVCVGSSKTWERADLFGGLLKNRGASPIFKRNRTSAWRLMPSGLTFGCDMRLFRYKTKGLAFAW